MNHRRPEKGQDDTRTEGESDSSLVTEVSSSISLFRIQKLLNPALSARKDVPTFGEEEGPDPVSQTVTEQREAGQAGPQTQEGRPPCGDAGSPAARLPGCGSEAGSGPGAPTQQQTIEEELACSRLLQFLNPDPLKLDLDSAEDNETSNESRRDQETSNESRRDPETRRDPGRRRVLVHSAFPIEPCSSLANAPILDYYRRVLQRQRRSGLSLAEGYCWPAVARGCDTVLISHSGDDPLTYLPPLLTHMQLVSVFSSLSARSGPLAVILCPGWDKAQGVYDRLEGIRSLERLHPTVLLVGQAKEEAKAAHIPKNCLLLVTTPFSLARLLAAQCFLFLQLCHLVLDEADELFSCAPEQMSSILQFFQKLTSSEERVSCPRQLLAVARHWSPALDQLLHRYMHQPCVIVTVMEEAALYGNVHQIVLLFLACTKVSVLLGALEPLPAVPQKTLIITSSPEEVEHVYQAVNTMAAFCLKAHEEMTFQFDFVLMQWRKDIGPGSHVILVSTDACLQALGIQDASCVVHYSFPSSPRSFGARLACMVDNFWNRTDKECSRTSSPPKSVLLLTERNSRHVTGVLQYLRRTDASLPPELLHFAQGVGRARELQRAGQPLCSYLKTYGFCRNSSVCPDRHSLCPSQDQPQHPSSGSMVVLPLYIKTASQYWGRIVRGIDDCYKNLASQMTAHYATEKLLAVDVVEGGLYCVQEEETYHRVQVTVVPERGDRLFCSVQVRFLDEGRVQEVKEHQLLQLPPQFHSLPPQAVEIILCRVKPIDGEVDWNPKVTRTISQKIRGLEHQARVVLSLGNCIFVDPMVRMTPLPVLKTFIHEHNVHTEILNTGMGTSNPQHLDLLRKIIQRAEPVAGEGEGEEGEEGFGMTGLEDSQVTVDVEGQVAEEAERRRAAAESLCCDQERSEYPPMSHKQEPAEPTLQTPGESLAPPQTPGESLAPPQTPGESLAPPQTPGEILAPPQTPGESLAPPQTPGESLAPPQTPGESLAPPQTPGESLAPPQTPGESLAPPQAPGESLAPPQTPGESLAPPQAPGESLAPGDQTTAAVTQDMCPDVDQWNSLIANLKHAAQCLRISDMKEFTHLMSTVYSVVGNATKHVHTEKTANATATQEAIKTGAPKSLHPQVKWFQRTDTVVINIKLTNPVSQTCEFFPDRVVYRGRVNNSGYHADLELLLPVAADRCSWEMKSNEPVITLVKRERKYWGTLLKRKSNFVSLDFDHFEDESITPGGSVGGGVWFVEGLGTDGCYVGSDSNSDSD